MPSLYGSASDQIGLYGNVLSDRNQKQAQQLNIPGAIAQPDAGNASGGSQEAAQSDWANFEDVFNKNRGYAGKSLTDVDNKVRETAGEKPYANAQLDTNKTPLQKGAQPLFTMPKAAPGYQAPSAPQAPTGVVNPGAPVGLQAGSLSGIQQKADLMKGYGDHEMPQAPQQPVLPSGIGVVGGQQNQVANPNQPDPAVQSQNFADEASPTAKPLFLSPTTAQPAAQEPIDPIQTSSGGPGPVSADGHPIRPDPVEGDRNGDGYVSSYESLLNDRDKEAKAKEPVAPDTSELDDKMKRAQELLDNAPTDQVSEDEQKKYDQLSNVNDLLASYGKDGGQAILGDINGQGNINSWDADIMNTGGGRTMWDQYNKQYKGKDEEYANAVDKSKHDAREYRDSLANQIKGWQGEKDGMLAAKPAEQAGPEAANPTGYSSLDEMMSAGGAGTDALDAIHSVSQHLDPVSALMNFMGKEGIYNGATVSEMFRGGVGLGGQEMSMQNIRRAFHDIQQDYSKEVADWVFKQLTPEVWKSLQGMNFGAAYKVLKDLIEKSKTNG